MRLFRLLVVVAVLAVAPVALAGSSAGSIVGVVTTGSSGFVSGTSQHFSYGVVLRNRSKTKDAFGVRVRVFVLGQSGLLGVYVTTVPFIPARGTFYLGNEPVSMTSVQKATGVNVVVSVGGAHVTHASLPATTAKTPTGHLIRGAVANHYRHPIVVHGTRLFAVYYDRAGKVIGGDRLKGVSFGGKRTIAPKKTAAFTARLGLAVSADRIAAVRVSVSPVLG